MDAFNHANGVAVEGPTNEAQAAKELLGQPIALGYERGPSMSMFLGSDGSFSLLPYWLMVYDVPLMLAHPRVLFPYGWYKAGIANVKFGGKASSSEVGEFAVAELTNFWERSLQSAQQVYDYGWLGAEAHYHEVKGLIRYHSMHAFFPLDVWAVTRGKHYRGFNLQNVTGWAPAGLGKTFLWGAHRWPAKGLWFTHNRQYDRFYGRSQLFGAWRPWRRLATRDASEEIIDMAVHRYGVGGFVMYYPPAAFQKATGQGVDYDAAREKSREFVETAKAGAVVALPNIRDKDGNRLWELERPTSVLDVSGLLEHAHDLHKEICCGIGVPPELLEASETGSGFSGRMIPMIGYYACQLQNARNLVHAFCVQSLGPLLKWMFGPDASFEPTVDLVVPDELTGKPPAQPAGGMPGAPGMPTPPPGQADAGATPGSAPPGAGAPAEEAGGGGIAPPAGTAMATVIELEATGGGMPSATASLDAAAKQSKGTQPRQQPQAQAAQPQQPPPSLPNWLGTPKPVAPAPPPHWEPRHMTMSPAAAQRQVANKLVAQGVHPNQAAQHGQAVAQHVDDYSTHPPLVYQRVLRNVYNRTEDFEGAQATARAAMGRAQQMAAVRTMATVAPEAATMPTPTATELATAFIEADGERSVAWDEYKDRVRGVAEEVAAALGCSPVEALTEHVDPRAFLPWRPKRGGAA